MFAEEFFTTFRFESTLEPDDTMISFRLLGLEFEMNLTEWAVRMGVAGPNEMQTPEWRKMELGVPGKNITFDGVKEWTKVAGRDAVDFCVNKSLGSDIQDPVLRLVQIYLGLNLLGQNTCLTRVSLTELYLMRRIQERKEVNLAFWLAYQSHQINRSKSRHLNLCHIAGIFFYRNINLIRVRKGLQMELCITPRLINLDYLLKYQIVRLVRGTYEFYEPGKVIPKPRKKTNLVQVTKRIQVARTGDKYSWESLVNQVHDQKVKIDRVYAIVDQIWNTLRRVDERRKQSEMEEQEEAEREEAEAEKEPAEEEQAEEEPAEEESEDEEQADEEDEQKPEDAQKGEEDPEDDKREKEEKEARLLQLAMHAMDLFQKQEALEKQAKQEKNEAPVDQPTLKKRS